MVWDTDVSGAYEIVETVRKRTLVVPRSLADALGLDVHTPAMVHVVPGCRLGAIRPLFGLLEVLSANLPTMSLQATERATALVIQMLADVGAVCRAQRRCGGGAPRICASAFLPMSRAIWATRR